MSYESDLTHELHEQAVDQLLRDEVDLIKDIYIWDRTVNACEELQADYEPKTDMWELFQRVMIELTQKIDSAQEELTLIRARKKALDLKL